MVRGQSASTSCHCNISDGIGLSVLQQQFIISYSPLEMALKTSGMNKLASAPGLSMLCTSPVSVEHVGAVAAAGALGELGDKSNVYSSDDIARIAESLGN